MFKIGDIVQITAEADATGMLDFKKGKGYGVGMIQYNFSGDFKGHIERHQEILLQDEGCNTDWYHCMHFKLKEDTIVEKKECLFKEGQVVWDVRVGKGVVKKLHTNDVHGGIEVSFDDGEFDLYTLDGKLLESDKTRSLYFSEPKIEAATEPLFEPTLEGGMTLAAVDKETFRFYTLVVGEETQEVVESVHSVVFEKELFDFYRLGEKINFK